MVRKSHRNCESCGFFAPEAALRPCHALANMIYYIAKLSRFGETSLGTQRSHRQRAGARASEEFTRKMREMNDRRTRTPLALVDTFGCQQTWQTASAHGMLREMATSSRATKIRPTSSCSTPAPSASTRKSAFTPLGRLTTQAAKPTRSSASAAACAAKSCRQGKKFLPSRRPCAWPPAEWRLPDCCTSIHKNKRVFSIETSMAASPRPPHRARGRVRAW